MKLYYKVVDRKNTADGGTVHYVEAYQLPRFHTPPGVPYKPILDSKFYVFQLREQPRGHNKRYLEDGTAPNVDILHSIDQYNDWLQKEEERKYIVELIASMKAGVQAQE